MELVETICSLYAIKALLLQSYHEIVDELSNNTSWEVEHGVDGPLVMVSAFSAWEPVILEKYLMKCQFISFGRKP